MSPVVKKVGTVIGLVVLAVLPGGFLLLALVIAGVKIFKPKPRRVFIPDPCNLCTPEEQSKCQDPMCQMNDSPCADLDCPMCTDPARWKTVE